MARSCGIRIGPRRFELVVLDGSPKRHKISAYYTGEFSPEDAVAYAAGDVTGVARELKAAAKAHRIPVENVTAIIATDHAAFRHVQLPFSDRQKIDQVLKFEVESELPQFDIDSVVVDYHILNSNDKGAELIVSAVPKEDVRRAISACEKAGFEALEVELEATAIVNAAFAADICHIDDAQLLVHVGEHSTCVVVVAGGEVKEFRVIHIGGMTHLASELQQGDSRLSDAGADGADDREADVIETIDPIEASRKTEQAVKRIRRELGRTISAARTPQEIEAIYASGMELPGLIGSEVMGVPVYVLDCFDADSGQPADGFGQLVAAYGGAFRQLGGGSVKAALRRDDLRFTGTWERLEFPIAFAALMLATFLGMTHILQWRKLDRLNRFGVLPWLTSSNNFIVGGASNADAKARPRMNPVPRDLVERAKPYYTVTAPWPEGLEMPIDELRVVEGMIDEKITELQKEVGDIQDVPLPPSAFTATTLVLGVLDSNPAWRPSLRALRASYEREKSPDPEHILIKLDATFFAKDSLEATTHLSEFDRALREQPWLMDVEDVKTEPIEGDGGLTFKGKTIRVDPSKFQGNQKPSSN
ncbi:Competence protein A [Planctomycetes bacterium Poly30]|uniref:Competence protein A n=1 Tax=Saltatorellus ferox TaxID=2528018 RepID=A0A518ELW6_9BACT|nr:Competence protein A [Planctomycetes bacterium Poly30]